MDARTLEALKASIAKWERNAEAADVGDVRLGVINCPLCRLFHGGDFKCHGCPVSAAGYRGCEGSPYDDADAMFDCWQDEPNSDSAAEEFRTAAGSEVAFLQSLLPKEPA